jgi:hypothetical protein
MASIEDFRICVLAHLAKYKTDKLAINTDGAYNGKFYQHILPAKFKNANILEPYSCYLSTSKLLSKIQLNTTFSHLNSSQAMCVNFFYPLIESNKLDLILTILGIGGKVDYDSLEFEKELTVEKTNERKTNFDFYLKTQDRKQIFFEIKYTEDGFFKAKNDKAHINKYNRTYKAALDKSAWIGNNFKTMQSFFRHYQMMRNLLVIDDKSYAVFIYPKDNDVVRRAAEEAKKLIVNQAGKVHLINKTWDMLLEELLQTKALDKVLEQYYDINFREKYLNY